MPVKNKHKVIGLNAGINIRDQDQKKNFVVAGASPFAEGALLKGAEGSLLKDAEGSSFKDAEGSINKVEALRKSAKAILKQDISGLEVIPPVAVKLLKLTNDEASSFADLSLIIETEPSLSLEVLRLVNSAFYSFSHKITSIKRAATVLGFSLIRQTALNLLFFKKMIKRNANREFNQIFFWQHCLFVATLSKTIATNIHHPDPDSVYAAGLLHDIGKMVLEIHGLHTYSDFLLSVAKKGEASAEHESNFFGITHAEMGAFYCHQCDLPEMIVNVAYSHHSFQTSTLDAGLELDIAIVSYANFLACLQGIGSVPGNCNPTLPPEVFTIINAYKLDLVAILEQVDKEISTISSFYNFRFPNLNELRANLIETIFKLNFSPDKGLQISQNEQPHSEKKRSISSLTMPHHSLDPDEFIPWTLEALEKEFNFDRFLLLDINPKRRSLVAKYCWPKDILSEQDSAFEIKVPSLSGQFLTCLRKKQAALIDDSFFTDRYILQQLKVNAFYCLPIITQNRISAVLYIDNAHSGQKLVQQNLPKLSRVANELGMALANARQFNQEKMKAQRDPLTGLNNKGMINDFLATLFAKQAIKLKKLAVGFIDIDHFKMFNDSYGHQAGDEVLRIVADTLKSLTRPNDFIGRYGGEEFLFVLVDTDNAGTKGFSERIRREIEKSGKMLSERFPAQNLTVSIGAAMYHPGYNDCQELIRAADEAMYQSKSAGRNRVTII